MNITELQHAAAEIFKAIKAEPSFKVLGASVAWFNALRERGLENFLRHPKVLKSGKRLDGAQLELPKIKWGGVVAKVKLSKEVLAKINELLRLDAYTLVFVDGVYRKDLSRLQDLPGEILLVDLATALSDDASAKLVQQYLTSNAEGGANIFAALNLALLNQGALLLVPDNMVLAKPVQIVFASSGTSRANNFFALRNLIVVGKNSKVSVLESHVALDDAVYVNNMVSYIDADDHAEINYVKLQNESAIATHLANIMVVAKQSSRVIFNHLLLKARFNLAKVVANFAYNKTSLDLSGLYLLHDSEQNFCDVVLTHVGQNTFSRVLYKGILYDNAKSDVLGKVIVQPGALGSDTDLKNYNLLVGDGAWAAMQPELEVYIDDVKCSHGATCGAIDEKALFYLRSRGIAESAAYNLLLRAFAQDVLEKITDTKLREFLDGIIQCKWRNN